jgi:hypothetical protein
MRPRRRRHAVQPAARDTSVVHGPGDAGRVTASVPAGGPVHRNLSRQVAAAP